MAYKQKQALYHVKTSFIAKLLQKSQNIYQLLQKTYL